MKAHFFGRRSADNGQYRKRSWLDFARNRTKLTKIDRHWTPAVAPELMSGVAERGSRAPNSTPTLRSAPHDKPDVRDHNHDAPCSVRCSAPALDEALARPPMQTLGQIYQRPTPGGFCYTKLYTATEDRRDDNNNLNTNNVRN